MVDCAAVAITGSHLPHTPLQYAQASTMTVVKAPTTPGGSAAAAQQGIEGMDREVGATRVEEDGDEGSVGE
jgi:hypothetical protein